MDTKFLGVIPAAVIVEGIITYINMFLIEGTIYWQIIASLIIGVVVAVSYKIDIPGLVGLETKIPLVSNILSGILISRGANYVWDLISKLSSN